MGGYSIVKLLTATVPKRPWIVVDWTVVVEIWVVQLLSHRPPQVQISGFLMEVWNDGIMGSRKKTFPGWSRFLSQPSIIPVFHHSRCLATSNPLN